MGRYFNFYRFYTFGATPDARSVFLSCRDRSAAAAKVDRVVYSGTRSVRMRVFLGEHPGVSEKETRYGTRSTVALPLYSTARCVE